MSYGQNDRDIQREKVQAANPNPSDAEEHRRAARTAQYVAGFGVLILAMAVFALIRGMDGLFWTGAGLFVAMLVVAAMLYFDSEHHAQAHDRQRDRPVAGK